MRLPADRGPVSAQLFAYVRGRQGSLPAIAPALKEVGDPLNDDDLQISLWTLYELHYSGFDEVSDDVEWDPRLIALRRVLESCLETELRAVTAADVAGFPSGPTDFAQRLFAFVGDFDGPSPARYIRNHATAWQAQEMLVHKSIYNLKEADPHTWVIPRLSGRAKVALVSLQYDEYGAGVPAQLHSQLFADTLLSAGLKADRGAYIDDVPAVTLANNNMLSLFGLHRRLRGAAMGHLAAFEATSSLPARDHAAGLTRLGMGAATPYFDEHVEADAVHEQIAARQICGEMVAADPSMAGEIVFGAAACLRLDAAVGADQLGRWESGVSSLRNSTVAAGSRAS